MKLLLPVLIALALSSCISLTKSGPSTTGEYLNSPENFILLDNTRTEALTTQYFFCWIPVGGKGNPIASSFSLAQSRTDSKLECGGDTGTGIAEMRLGNMCGLDGETNFGLMVTRPIVSEMRGKFT